MLLYQVGMEGKSRCTSVFNKTFAHFSVAGLPLEGSGSAAGGGSDLRLSELEPHF